MSKGNATNILVILAVAAVVAGAVWFKSQRASDVTDQDARAATPAPAASEESPESASTPVLSTDSATAVEQPGTGDAERTPAKLPRLVDLGADKCIPCKKLAPILKALREEYKGKLAVEVIDVWKSPEMKALYGIRLIPTQILYDTQGKEVWRHEGFISKDDLKAVFAQKVAVK